MKTLEWPGIATAVGIIAICAIALDLSKWQQLTAGLLAFSGGVMAYLGAMAKVEHDALQVERDLLRRRLSLYLKLDMAARRMIPIVQLANAHVGFASVERPFETANARLREPPELAEAWQSLDVFPRSLIRQIAIIRNRIQDVEEMLDECDQGKIVFLIDFNDLRNPARTLYGYNDDIILACMLIEKALGPEIERLAPDASEDDKQLARYGEPHFDDD